MFSDFVFGVAFSFFASPAGRAQAQAFGTRRNSSVAKIARAVFRFKANTSSDGHFDRMGRDITFSDDYLIFMLAALTGIGGFTHKWPHLLGITFCFVVAKFALQWLLGSLFESRN